MDGQHRRLRSGRREHQPALLGPLEEVPSAMIWIRYLAVADDIFGGDSGYRAAMSRVERGERERIERAAASAMPAAQQQDVTRRDRSLDRIAHFLADLPEQRAPLAIHEQATFSVHLAVRDGVEGGGEHREDKPKHTDR